MRFNPRVKHVPGKELIIADTLSRSPLKHTVEDEKKVEEIKEYEESVKACLPTTSTQLEKIKCMTARDPLLQQVAVYITEGWPKSVSLPVMPFEQVKGELSIYDGMLLKEQRIVIPQALQKETLEKVHEGHQGKSKCRERANSAVWWPGIGKEIHDLIEACPVCAINKPAQRQEPLKPTQLHMGWDAIYVSTKKDNI